MNNHEDVTYLISFIESCMGVKLLEYQKLLLRQIFRTKEKPILYTMHKRIGITEQRSRANERFNSSMSAERYIE